MPSFIVTGRKTTPLDTVTIDAPSHQEAIQQVVDMAVEGEQIEVLSCVEADPAEVIVPSGPSGVATRSSKRE